MRWHIKRTKLLFALIPIISIAFFILTANNNIFADQSFAAFDIYMNICDTASPVAGKDSPRDYSAAENFAIAAQVYNDTDSVQGSVTGTITALGGFYTQKVINYHAKTGGYIFNESVSLSAIASVAEQRFFKDNALLYRKGETSGSTVTGWADSVTELASVVYRQRYGIVPHEITKYSVTSGTEDEPGSIKSGKLVSENPDGTFTYELELDAEEAQKYSRYEMMTFAGVTEYPKFQSCRLVYTIDSNWRVLEIKSYDVYEIAIMNGIRCESSLTDTFTYLEGYMPERAQIFIDYVPTGNTGDIGAQKGPSEYLSEAFGDYISGAKPLTLSATAAIAGETLDITASIDIKNNVFDFLIADKIFAVYKNNEIFVSVGDNKYRVSIADLKPALDMLGINIGGLELDASILDALFADHSIVETDTHVHILMPFELMGIKFDVDMGLVKTQDGKTKADTIDAVIDIGGTEVDANVQITDSANMPNLNESEHVSLKPLIDAVIAAINAPAYQIDGSVSATANGKSFPLGVSARIVKKDNDVAAEGKLNVIGVDIDFAYLDGTVYADVYGLKIKANVSDIDELTDQITEFLQSIGIEATLPDISVSDALTELIGGELGLNTVLDVLSRISYDGRTLSANLPGVALTLEHDSFLSRVTLQAPDILGIGLNADLSITEGDTTPVEADESQYIDVKTVANLLPTVAPFVEPIINTVQSDSFMITLGGNLAKDGLREQISGVITVNLSPALSLAGSIRVSGTNIEFAYTQNTLYITVGAFNLKLRIADAQSLLSSVCNIFGSLDEFMQNLSTLIGAEQANALIAAVSGMDSLIDSFASGGDILSKLGFLLPELNRNGIESVLKSVSAYGNTLHVTVSPADGSDYSVSLTVNRDLLSYVALSGLKLFGYTLDMSAALECGGTYDTNVNDSAYTDLTELKPILDTLPSLLSSNKFELRIGEGKINTSVISGEISGKVQISLNPLQAVADLTFGKHKINLLYRDETVYARINNIKLKFGISDIESLVAEINELTKQNAESAAAVLADTLEYVGIIENALGGKTLADVLSYVTYFGKTDNGICATVNAGDFTLTLALSQSGNSLVLDVTDFGYGSDVFDSSALVSLSAISSLDAFGFELDSFVNLASVQSYIKPVINTLGEKYFNLTFDGTVVSSKNAITSIDGELKLMRTQAFADVYARIELSGSTGAHSISLYLLDNTDYSAQANPEGKLDKGKITAYANYNGFLATIDYESVMRILGAASDILNLDIPMLDDLTKDYYNEQLDASVFETMDIMGLDELRSSLKSLLGTAEDVTDTANKGGIASLLGLISDKMIDDMLLGLSLSFDENGFLEINIDNAIFNALNDSTARVTIGHDGDRITYAEISNLKVNGNTVDFAARLDCEQFDPLTAPEPENGNKLYDFSSLDELLVSVIKTASLKQFDITGNIKLNVLGIIKPTVPFDAKIKILDDGSTVAAIKLEVPFVSAVVGVALTRSDSYIYYANNMLYFVVDVWSSWAWSEGSYKQTEMKSATVEEFLANPFEYLFFLLRLGDMVKDPITNAVSGASGGTPSSDINQILKDYSYNSQTGGFALTLGLKEATGSKDLRDLALTLDTTDGYISGLGMSTSFTDMNISLSIENTVLANLRTENGKVTGADALADVSFGRSDKAANLGGSIDNLEDYLAVLFPVEAAETFAEKANDKAAKATSAAKAAIASSQTVADCIEAQSKALADLNAAKAKLESIAKDSFGYERAEINAEYAQKVYERAVESVIDAKADRITATQKAVKAGEDAYYYARKAASAAQTVSTIADERAISATASAALASVTAIEAASYAADSTISTAIQAGEEGKETLAKAQELYETILSTITDTAAQAASAANKACTESIKTAATAVAKAQSYAADGDWFNASEYAAHTLDAISAMDTADKAACKAALMSGDDDLLATALSNSETVKTTRTEHATTAAIIATDAANIISEEGKRSATNAFENARVLDHDATKANIAEALLYARASLNAAQSAQSAVTLIENEQIAQAAAKASDAANEAAEFIGGVVLDSCAIAVEKCTASVLSDISDVETLSAKAVELGSIAQYAEYTAQAKVYADESGTNKLIAIYNSAAQAASAMLEKSNMLLADTIASYGNTLLDACISIDPTFGSKTYSGNIYSSSDNPYDKLAADANALKNQTDKTDASILELYAQIANNANNIYVSTIPFLQDSASVKTLLYSTLKDSDAIGASIRNVSDASDKAVKIAGRLVEAASNLSGLRPVKKSDAEKAAANAQTSANALEAATEKASAALDTLESLYNTFFAS